MRSPLWVEGIGTKSSTGPSFLGPSRCGHPWGRECSFSIVTKDLPFFLDIHLGLVASLVSLAVGHWICLTLL